MAYTVVSETVCKILSINYYPTLFISSAYSVVEYLFMVYIFYPLVASKKTKIYFIILTVFYFLVYLWSRLLAQGMFVRIYSQIAAESFCLILISGLVIHKIAEEFEGKVVKNPHFIFAFTILFYFSTNIFLFAVKGSFTLEENKLIANYIWGIHSIVNFLLHVFITLAMWFNSRRIK